MAKELEIPVASEMMTAVAHALDGLFNGDAKGHDRKIGSAALASTFASTPAAREFYQLPELCICETCACTRPLAVIALAVES